MTRRHAASAGSALAVLLVCTAATAQPSRETDLRAALLAEPGQIDRYLSLASYYQRENRIEEADRVLRDAVTIDPAARRVHEQRVRLFATPFQPRRIGPIALEWMSADGTNPVPVMLSAGHRLRLASARRGDGTSAALDEIDAALGDVDGAVPAHPYHRGLAEATVTLLHARASLTDDLAATERWRAAARDAQTHLEALPQTGQNGDSDAGTLAEIVAAMLRPVPFGPRGAVRAGSRVPRPRLLTEPRLPQRQPVRTGRRGLVTLELVIDTWGRVVQVYPLDSSEGFNQAIGDAIAQWRYEPTRLDGELVPVILTMTVLR